MSHFISTKLFYAALILLAFPALASKTPKFKGCKHTLDDLYVTDHPESFGHTLEGRRALYDGKNYEVSWPKERAEFSGEGTAEEKLVVGGLVVMHKAEAHYMQKLAEIVTGQGGNVLNVGAGLNLVDSGIESLRVQNRVDEHHVIEMNEEVMLRAEAWRKNQAAKEKIYLHLGDWNDVLEQMKVNGVKFSGVIYDAFPLKEKDLHRDVVPFLQKLMALELLEEDGVITFYMDSKDGLGEKFRSWLSELGIQRAEIEKVPFQGTGDTDQYWVGDFFAPRLSGVRYPHG